MNFRFTFLAGILGTHPVAGVFNRQLLACHASKPQDRNQFGKELRMQAASPNKLKRHAMEQWFYVFRANARNWFSLIENINEFLGATTGADRECGLTFVFVRAS
jgi:hypothetical protein